MNTSIKTSAAIEHIYEASYKPEYWPIALEKIADYTNSYSAALVYQDNELKRAGGSYAYNISDENITRYNSYGGINPNVLILAENMPVGTAAAIDHIIPDRNNLEKAYGDKYCQLIEAMDLYCLGGAILFMDETRTAGIGIQRTQSMGVWEQSDIDNLTILVPHIQRATNIQKEFLRFQTRELAFRKGLNELLMGLILFDKELQVIYVNPVAKSILDKHPAIKMKNNKIYAYNQEQTAKIHSALITAIASKPEPSAEIAGTSMGLKHPDCATTLPLNISPVQGVLQGFETEHNHAHAVICFSDPGMTHPIKADKLSDIYELTPAEAQVAIAIANGINTEKIASMNDVAISTIRSQLKAIYLKLGINSQAELVKILLTGPFNGCL